MTIRPILNADACPDVAKPSGDNMATLPEIRAVHARSLTYATEGGWCAAYAQDVGVLLAEIDRLTAPRPDRIRAGMDRARREGRHVGRPRKEVDVERAAEMWSEGMSLKGIARTMGLNRSTLRRRLNELGIDTAEGVSMDVLGGGGP